METEKIMYTVEVTIEVSPKVRPMEGVYHIKWEENLVKEIHCDTFKFSTLDLETAMNRVNYLVNIHPKITFLK